MDSLVITNPNKEYNDLRTNSICKLKCNLSFPQQQMIGAVLPTSNLTHRIVIGGAEIFITVTTGYY